MTVSRAARGLLALAISVTAGLGVMTPAQAAPPTGGSGGKATPIKGPTAAAQAPPTGQGAGALECQQNYATYGFASAKECTSYVTKGGTLTVPAKFTLTRVPPPPEFASQTNWVWIRAEGSGLKPNSTAFQYVTQIFTAYPDETWYNDSNDYPVDAAGNFLQVRTWDCAERILMTDLRYEYTDASGQVHTTPEMDNICINGVPTTP